MSAVARFAAALTCAWLALALAPAAGAQPAPPAKPVTAPPASGGQEKPKPPAAPAPAARPAAQRASGPPAFHVAGFFTFGYQGFAAKNTFDATLGKSGGPVLGGGGSITHRSGLFAQVDFTRFTADGERAFAYNGEVFPLGIPLSVEVRPIEVTVGYKFFVTPKRRSAPPATPPRPLAQPARPRPGEAQAAKPPATPPPAAAARPARPPFGGIKPYVGAGFGKVAYKEASEFAGSGDDVDESYTSFHVLGGLEAPVWKWFGAAAEVHWRRVSDAFGEAGLSKEFGEDDLGGLSFRVKVTVGR